MIYQSGYRSTPLLVFCSMCWIHYRRVTEKFEHLNLVRILNLTDINQAKLFIVAHAGVIDYNKSDALVGTVQKNLRDSRNVVTKRLLLQTVLSVFSWERKDEYYVLTKRNYAWNEYNWEFAHLFSFNSNSMILYNCFVAQKDNLSQCHCFSFQIRSEPEIQQRPCEMAHKACSSVHISLQSGSAFSLAKSCKKRSMLCI